MSWNPIGDGSANGSSRDLPEYVRVVENQTPSIEHFMWEDLNDVTINSIANNGKTVNLAPGHGFVSPVGVSADYFNIYYKDPADDTFVGNIFSQHTVISVTGDQIEITPPIAYHTGFNPTYVTVAKRVNVNMAVLGTRASPVVFKTYPPAGQVWEIRRFIGDMIMTSAGDDGLFGNLALLSNGEYFEFENDFFKANSLAVFDNGGYKATGYDVSYATRSGGGGSYGMSFRKTVAGPDKSGVVILMDGDTNDVFSKYTQDDLTGLVRYRIKVMGNILD